MKNYLEYLKHIRAECEFLIEKSEGPAREKFVGDETPKSAFVRSLELIGEAAKKISDEFKQKYQDGNWGEMTGIGDVLLHGYFGINYNIVWDVVNHVPHCSMR